MSEKCFCGSGKKKKKCHPYVIKNSKLADIYLAYQNFDKKVYKEHIAASCPNDCCECCYDFFFISENEFLTILDYLMVQGNYQIFMEKAKNYADFIKKHYPNIHKDIDCYMETMNNENFDAKYFNDNYFWKRDIPCIFLKNGKCAIYEVRPAVCRGYGVCQYCSKINNNLNILKEQDRMIETTTYIKNETTRILKRAYPIYYFFSYFLSDKYFKTTLIKLNYIRNLTEKEYADFCEKLSEIK